MLLYVILMEEIWPSPPLTFTKFSYISTDWYRFLPYTYTYTYIHNIYIHIHIHIYISTGWLLYFYQGWMSMETSTSQIFCIIEKPPETSRLTVGWPPCFWDQKSSCYMSVSLNGGTRKSSILIGFSIMFTIHFGVPLFLETPIFLLEVFFVSKNDLHDLPWRQILGLNSLKGFNS